MLDLHKVKYAPLFVAASTKGTFYIFNTEGTLLYRDEMVESGESVYAIEGAGVSGNEGYIIPKLTQGFPRYKVQWDSSSRDVSIVN